MRPTAIFANNDYAAVIAMSEAQQMGLAIPDDISVVGYDNSYLARLGYIGLTTIDNNYVEMGRLAVLRLVERINAPNAPRTITLLDPSLALRSTQPLRLLFVRAEPNQYLTGDSVLVRRHRCYGQRRKGKAFALVAFSASGPRLADDRDRVPEQTRPLLDGSADGDLVITDQTRSRLLRFSARPIVSTGPAPYTCRVGPLWFATGSCAVAGQCPATPGAQSSTVSTNCCCRRR